MKFRSVYLQAVTLLFLIVLAYWRAPGNGKVWDDISYLTGKHQTSLGGLKQMWQEPTSTKHPYYPLTRTTFWIENFFWGENLFVSHLTNIFLHALNSLLLWRVLNRLKLNGSWIIAAVYAVHPVCVESAAWIAERKNVLGVFFYLSSLCTFLMFYPLNNSDPPELGRKELYYISLFLFLCSLLSKTAFCTLPVSLLLIIWWKQEKLRAVDLRLITPYFLVAFILGSLTIFLEKTHTGAQGHDFKIGLLERFLIAGRAFWFYIGKILFPYAVNFMYPRWQIDRFNWTQYLYPLFLFVVIATLWALRFRIGKGPLAAVLFFIVTLIPAIGFINHYLMRYTFVADHLQYLPMIGFLSLIVSIIHYFFSSRLPRIASVFFWSCILIVLGFLTWRQTAIYKDEFTLYNDIISKNPSCWMALNNRGLIYLNRGQSDAAISDFNRSIESNSSFEEAYVSRGHYYFQQKRYREAFNDFSQAITINPQLEEAYRNRGSIFFLYGKYDRALADFNRALYLNPQFARAYNARGAVFSVIKKYEFALQDYDAAIKIDPGYKEAYRNRSRLLQEMGRPEDAQKDALKAQTVQN